jgi:thiopeptide-type bacteriocin biosynthesis protein
MSAAPTVSTHRSFARAPRPEVYRLTERVLVRAPAMSVELYRAMSERAKDGADAEWVDLAPGTLLPSDARIRAAIAVGSPSLFERLGGAGDARGDDGAELRRKLHRYLVRMSTRATPFGLFAGVALGRWAETTDLSLAGTWARTRARPDMAWLAKEIAELESRGEVRRRLKLLTNPLAFVHGGRVLVSQRGRDDAPVSLRATGVVLRALDLAREPVRHADLAAALLASSAGATREKVDALLDQLWKHGVLVTDLRPSPTADDPLAVVLRALEGVAPAADARARIEEAVRAASGWKATETQAAAGMQVDAAHALRGSCVSREIGLEAARAAEILLRMTPSPAGLRYLAAYRESFVERYGMEREVPLLELLDPACGIPYAQRRMDLSDPKRDPAVLGIALRALRERRRVVTLDDALVRSLSTFDLDLARCPRSLDINVLVAARSRDHVARGEYAVVAGPVLGAQAAGRLLGRFADMLPDARQELEAILRAEQALTPGALWADLVDTPHDPHGTNVVLRPGLATHEIPVGALPSVPAENVIRLRELVVGVRDDRFYVRWPRGGTRVHVRSGHMLNPASCGTVGQFLMEASHDGKAVLAPFQWGPAKSFPFLPRIQVGRLVLSLARWRLDAAEARRDLGAGDRDAFARAFADWRRAWDLPRLVYVGDIDHRMLLDLDHPLHVEELRREIQRTTAGEVELQEGVPGIDDAWLEGEDGHHVCELAVSLVRDPPKAAAATTTPPAPPPQRALPPRSAVLRPPGTEWLFVKLYAAKHHEEELIAGPIRRFARQAVEQRIADDWYFVRYLDPDVHVRLRFRGAPERLTRELAPAAFAWAGALMNDGVCARFVVDTYDREVERYGGEEGMRIAEAIASADSAAVAELLALPRDFAAGYDRTDLAVLSTAQLLGALGLDEDARRAWLRELGLKTARTECAEQYRRRRDRLVAMLPASPDALAAVFGRPAADALAARADRVHPLGRELAAAAQGGALTQTTSDLFRSYMHMHCNRVFGVDHAVERRVYGLLARAHDALKHQRSVP